MCAEDMYYLDYVSYNTVVSYSRNHGVLGFLALQYRPEATSLFLFKQFGSSKLQKCLQSNS